MPQLNDPVPFRCVHSRILRKLVAHLVQEPNSDVIRRCLDCLVDGSWVGGLGALARLLPQFGLLPAVRLSVCGAGALARLKFRQNLVRKIRRWRSSSARV